MAPEGHSSNSFSKHNIRGIYVSHKMAQEHNCSHNQACVCTSQFVPNLNPVNNHIFEFLSILTQAILHQSHLITYQHGCQNLDLDLTILRFYDSTYPKRSKSFKDLCDRSGSVGLYDSDDPKRSWFLVIFFNLTEGSVEPK